MKFYANALHQGKKCEVKSKWLNHICLKWKPLCVSKYQHVVWHMVDCACTGIMLWSLNKRLQRWKRGWKTPFKWPSQRVNVSLKPALFIISTVKRRTTRMVIYAHVARSIVCVRGLVKRRWLWMCHLRGYNSNKVRKRKRTQSWTNSCEWFSAFNIEVRWLDRHFT